MKYQRRPYDCGVAAIINAIRCYGKKMSYKRVIAHSATTPEDGTNEHGIKNAIERLEFIHEEIRTDTKGEAFDALCKNLRDGYPCILLLDRGQHWATAIGLLYDAVVVFDSQRTKANKSENGCHVYHRSHLMKRWTMYDGKYYAIVVKK